MVRFTPLTPARLVEELARWARSTADVATRNDTADGAARSGRPVSTRGTVIGFDGPHQIGATGLADLVAAELRISGLPVIRSSTSWWWRASALRLEFGRQDVDMLLTGWVDAEALRRELVEPVLSGMSPHLTRLRDPQTDRSVRQLPEPTPPGSILLLDGPFLLATHVPLDGLVQLGVGRGALTRALSPDLHWWIPAFDRYRDEYQAHRPPDVLLAYDHAASPAAAGLGRAGMGTARFT